jgi:Flp pilus assembly protein TadG
MMLVSFSVLRELWRSPPRGMALVEFGLAAPILILLLVTVIDLGLAFYQALQVQGAASAGAAYASRHAWDATGVNITNVVQAATDLGNKVTVPLGFPNTSQVCGCTNTGLMVEEGALPASGNCSSFTTCTGGGGVYAKVKVQMLYSTLITYPGLPSPLTLTGTAYRRTQ